MKSVSAEMSIQAGLYGLSFLYRHGREEIFRRISYGAGSAAALTSLLEQIRQEHWREIRPGKIRVLHENDLAVSVPRSLYNEKNKRLFLDKAVKLFPSDTVEADEISSFDVRQVYVPYENVNNFFVEHFGEIEYYHASSPFLAYAADTLTEEGVSVAARLVPRGFQMAVWEPGKLLFYNRFPMQNVDDFLYYFFFVWEKWELQNRHPAVTLLTPDEGAEEIEKNLEVFLPRFEVKKVEKEILSRVL